MLYYIKSNGGKMRELLLVSISALLGYIIFSAFSTSETPKEAIEKIIEQPHRNFEENHKLAVNRINTKHEERLISLENQHKIETLKVYGDLEKHTKENETKIALKKLDNQFNHQLAILQVEAKEQDKNKNNATLIILALLLFLLIFIYLKHKKYLSEIELQRKIKYDEMMLKKEYAEKILAYMSEGNLSFETEKRLLAILDELNGKTVKPVENTEFYHPNPDIIQLSSNLKQKQHSS